MSFTSPPRTVLDMAALTADLYELEHLVAEANFRRGERELLKLLRSRGIDGLDGHSSRQSFERDRLKWATRQAQGLTAMPVTARQIRNDPD